nr:hypothetical protein [Haladaptatus sp. DYSN1]
MNRREVREVEFQQFERGLWLSRSNSGDCLLPTVAASTREDDVRTARGASKPRPLFAPVTTTVFSPIPGMSFLSHPTGVILRLLESAPLA